MRDRSRPKGRRRRAAAAIEYLMVLTFVVIPLACLTPMILHMIGLYLNRIVTMIRLPLG